MTRDVNAADFDSEQQIHSWDSRTKRDVLLYDSHDGMSCPSAPRKQRYNRDEDSDIGVSRDDL